MAAMTAFMAFMACMHARVMLPMKPPPNPAVACAAHACSCCEVLVPDGCRLEHYPSAELHQQNTHTLMSVCAPNWSCLSCLAACCRLLQLRAACACHFAYGGFQDSARSTTTQCHVCVSQSLCCGCTCHRLALAKLRCQVCYEGREPREYVADVPQAVNCLGGAAVQRRTLLALDRGWLGQSSVRWAGAACIRALCVCCRWLAAAGEPHACRPACLQCAGFSVHCGC